MTGEPGSGKSHTIREYVSYLRDSGIEPAITASTGIAATHIHGMTLHSWSGIGIKKNLSSYDIEAIAGKNHVYKRISRTSVLIIDEVSMLDADTLESADVVCREARRNPMEAFGGMQVVFVGDFFQLPPISKYGEPESSFSFHSKTWRDAKPIVCYLSEQHRQDDAEYLSVLSAIRKNKCGEDHESLMRSRVGRHEGNADMPRLFSHNVDVDGLNTKRLAEIEAKEEIFEMETSGRAQIADTLKRGCLSPEILKLKVGAAVMCTKNNPAVGYVNGTLGQVVKFAGETGYPIIKTRGGRLIEMEPAEWAVEEGGKILARVVQIPLRLAWAITIHKSQGMSMDAAVMDLSDVFEYGQGYVALSRVRRFSGLYLSGYNAKSLQVHPEILGKDIEYKKQSAAARAKFEPMEGDELDLLHRNFIRALGGKYVSDEDRKKMPRAAGKSRRSSDPAKNTREITLDMLNDGKSVSEIAASRNLKASTIIDHIYDLLFAKKIDESRIAHLAPRDEKGRADMFSIHETFEKLGADKLKPVYEHHEGLYSYDTLRLARLLFNKDK